MSLPFLNVTLLVRTDFADERSWETLCAEVTVPSEHGFLANLSPVSDPAFDGRRWEAVKAAVPVHPSGPVIVLIADATTLGAPDHAVLVVDLMDFRGEHLQPFRCIPSQLWAVENNIVFNMFWEEFADNTDEHGVFRGF